MINIRSLYNFFYNVGGVSLKIGRGRGEAKQSILSLPSGVLNLSSISGLGEACGITTQSRTESIGNPYLDGDVFCVFDGFDFAEGYMVFDNSFAANNIALFHDGDVETICSHLDQLTSDAIIEYLNDEAQEHGLPIFVGHEDIALSEAETLEVIISHLMGDYYYFTKRNNKQKRWEFTPNNVEVLQNYLPENNGDNNALAIIINLARTYKASMLSHYYNGMKGMINNRKKVKKTLYKIDKNKTFHQRQGVAPYKEAAVKRTPIQWFEGDCL